MPLPFLRLNQVILIILFSDFIFTAATAITAPVFALFVVEDIAAPVSVVGFAVAIFWIVKSLLQLPFARYLDKNHGETDDFYSMVAGLGLSVLVFGAYYFAKEVWHIYALQALLGVGQAFFVPPFLAIFTRHLDQDSEGFEWALRSSFSTGAGMALGGAASGILAASIGIRPLFLIHALLAFLSLIVLVFLKPYLLPRVPREVSRVLTTERR